PRTDSMRAPQTPPASTRNVFPNGLSNWRCPSVLECPVLHLLLSGRVASACRLRDHRIAERRPHRSCPIAEILVAQGETRQADFRVDPQKCAGLPEMAVGSRRIRRTGPMRGLPIADFESESPVVGALRSEAGQHTIAAGKLDGR